MIGAKAGRIVIGCISLLPLTNRLSQCGTGGGGVQNSAAIRLSQCKIASSLVDEFIVRYWILSLDIIFGVPRNTWLCSDSLDPVKAYPKNVEAHRGREGGCR